MIRWRWYVAKLLDRWFPKSCWFDLGAWAFAKIRWREIEWQCTDAEDSGRGVCWCGKLCTKNRSEQ